MANHERMTEQERERLLADYEAAVALTHILIDRSPPPKHPADVRARAIQRLERLRRLLRELGEPHLRCPVIHIGGTSGKGSTAIAAAAILRASGKRVGLYTSPYLQSATEKLQIDGALIDGSTLRSLVEDVRDASIAAGIAPVTYGELWFAMVALAFARAEVEIAVIEVGAGGRFDLTNVVQPAVSVITSVGLDHTETLGETIAEIAWHKAGIVKPGAPVVSAVTDPDAMAVIEREAAETGSRLIPALAGESIELEAVAGGRYGWRLTSAPDQPFETAMPGRYQAINAATALLAIEALPTGLVSTSPESVRSGLRDARFQGRFETMQTSPTVVLDGAHNPEKMHALVRETRSWRLAHPEAQVIAVVGVLDAKEHRAIVAEAITIADALITTSPQVLAKPGASAAELASEAAELGFAGPMHAEDDPERALKLALAQAGSEDLVLVTGSLYLVGNVRGRWFPDHEVVLQQTPWPIVSIDGVVTSKRVIPPPRSG